MVRVTIIGQGYVGLPLAVEAAKAGFKVVGFDIDAKKVNKLKSGEIDFSGINKRELLVLQSEGKLKFTDHLDNKDSSEIFIIAVPTPLDSDRKPDLSMLYNACITIAEFATKGSLIINESTSYIGNLRHLVRHTIDKNSKVDDLEYAVAPERIDPGNTSWNIGNTPRYVSGLTANASKRALEFYGSFCKEVHEVETPEILEAAKLFENTFRHINIALVNEFANLAHQFNFSAHDVINIASSKPFGFMPFYPSIGVGGHCIPVDPAYLNYSASNVGLKFNFVNLADEINYLTPQKIAMRIINQFSGNSIGMRVQLAGIAYKPNIADVRESPALALMNELEKKGCILSWHDPLVEEHNNQKTTPLDPTVDLGLIIAPHDAIDFSIWKQSGTKVFDLSADSKNYGWPKFL